MPARNAISALLLSACLAAASCGGDGGARSDAAPAPPPSDAAPRADGRIGIDCLESECPPGDFCCVTQVLEKPPRYAGICYPPKDAGPCDGIALECDGPEDCASDEVCCDGDAIRCLPRGQCPNTIICHLDDHCPAGRRCAETPRGIVDACQ